VYGLQMIGTMNVCGRSDCQGVALAAAAVRLDAA